MGAHKQGEGGSNFDAFGVKPARAGFALYHETSLGRGLAVAFDRAEGWGSTSLEERRGTVRG